MQLIEMKLYAGTVDVPVRSADFFRKSLPGDL